MELARILPNLLGAAWLLPLVSFALIVFFGPRMGRGGRCAGYLATLAILASCVLSLVALGLWLNAHPLAPAEVAAADHGGHASASHAAATTVPAIVGEWYSLASFGNLRFSIGYYIDALTLAMFAMVSFIATCIHVYSFGYMHEELHEVTDAAVTLPDGHLLVRRGRFHRFYQYLSLFCFSMLGLVVAGNILMVFLFWELVGICSYFLIGFYIERRSASNAANKAFIVNRVGDFGMIVGLAALCGALGTFSFGDQADFEGNVQPGLFSLVRPAAEKHELTVSPEMVRAAASGEIAKIHTTTADPKAADREIAARLPTWREAGYGYGLLVIAGLGIFCGCVGKSAQFPLHVWLPDAMEGPTPVSALIHAATMVAAGVYLVGRFYPVFAPEVLLVVAYVGGITLFIAATIALTATDIKRVLAYSTVSQLGYMMLALGVGGWIAGLFHLFTHAFFKALLFLCSGSVIHATGTNEMPRMGGLAKKMPWTAGTMLVGCLAIAGAGIPTVIGLSGYYSKDAMLAQLFVFRQEHPFHGWLFYVATGAAALTAFYMFRLWFLTFAGKPRDHHVFEHAHESPRVMYLPLVALAFFAVVAGWQVPGLRGGLTTLLEQARPLGTAEGMAGGSWLTDLRIPAEHLSHAPAVHVAISWVAFGMAAAGFALALAFYGLRTLNPDDVRHQFPRIYAFLRDKWRFDELYGWLFLRPTHAVARGVADFDRRGIDGVADGSARWVRGLSGLDDWIDRLLVDGAVNGTARLVYGTGLWLRGLQTGNIRQYVMYVVVATVGLFVLISLYWYAAAG